MDKIKRKKIKIYSIFIIFFVVISLNSQINIYAIEKIKPNDKIINLINKLFVSFMIEDEKERIKAILPLVHDSMKTKDKKYLSRDILLYSYKKAYQNYKFYKFPVEIDYVIKGRNLTIGYKETAEYGRIDKYFIKKKENVAGLSAPISIFIPIKDNVLLIDKAKIIDFGSL